MGDDRVGADVRFGLARLARASTSLLRAVLLIVAASFLTSIGGLAIYAAPLTLPLLFLVAVTSRATGWRVAAAVVGSLTVLEVGWMLTWVLWSSPVGSLLLAIGATTVCVIPFWVAALGAWAPGQAAR